MLTRHSSTKAAYATTLLFSSLAMAESSHEQFHNHQPRAQYVGTASGCYSSGPGSMTSQGSYTWQSSAHCGNICAGLNKPVMAMTNTNECACGDLLPATSDKLDTSACSSPCTGFPDDSCGSTSGAYTVWLTGVDNSVGSVSGSSGSEPEISSAPAALIPASSAIVATSEAPPPPVTTAIIPVAVTRDQTSVQTKAVTARPTTIVQGQQTIVKTMEASVQTVQAPVATDATDASTGSSDDHESGSASTIGIAVGVVVGVILLAVAIVFMVLYQRRRRRLKNAENGHARADSLNAFVAQGGTLPGVGLANDSRLDPRIMVENRRQSAGSVFADNQDYSRRILKVANPSEDGS